MSSLATRFTLGLRKAIGHAFLLTGLGLGVGEFFVKWYHASDVIVILYVVAGLMLIGMDMAAAKLIRTVAAQIVVQPTPDDDAAGSASDRDGGNGGGSAHGTGTDPGTGAVTDADIEDTGDDANADGTADTRWPAGQSIALARFLDRRTVPIPDWTVRFPDRCAVLSGARG